MSSTSPRRVCHISTVHTIRDVRVFVRECGSLVKAGYEVHIVIGHPKSEVVDGIHVHAIPQFSSRLRRMAFGPWYALTAALRTKSELYHYHDPELIWMGFILRWLFFKPVVFDIHESVYRQVQSKTYLSKWFGWLLGQIYWCVEKVLGLGQVKVVANENSVKDYRNPILLQNYPKQLSITPQRARFTKGDIPSLVYVGAVTEIRGAMIYLELARRLVEAGREFEMKIIGPIGSVPFENRMREISRNNGTEKQVTIAGPQPWSIAMQEVADATIGMCLLHPVPNYTTCLATKIIEYMMLGTPALASDFDCWRPYVEGEQTGCMADPMNNDDVFKTCVEMLDDYDRLREMSARGPGVVSERYSWEREFEKLDNCYKQILGPETR